MKLINVDNFLKRFSYQVPGDTIDAIDFRLALSKEPKVDAIPIEWIKKWIPKNEERYALGVNPVRDLLEDWEKENEEEID